jgi:hypothetical protein
MQYPFAFSICDAGSSCETCFEDVHLTLEVEAETRIVYATGRAVSGEVVKQRLSNCFVENAKNWDCRDLRGILSVTNGRLQYSPQSRYLLVDGKRLEVCVRP